MTDYLPFRLVSDTQKKEIDTKLSLIVNGWLKIWFSSLPDLSIAKIETDQVLFFNANEWLVFGRAPDAWVAWKLDGIVSRELLSMMFNFSIGNSAKLSPIMIDIVKDAAFSFVSELTTYCQSDNQSFSELSEPVDSLRTGWGSGTISVKFKIGTVQQHIAIGGDYVGLLSPLGPYNIQGVSLTKREDAINDYKTSLDVLVGNTDVTLDELANLEVGDVIRLGSLIQEPFSIRSSDGKPMANAYLGVNGNFKVVKLIE